MATNEILGLMNYVFGRILSTFPLLRRYSDRIDEIAHLGPLAARFLGE